MMREVYLPKTVNTKNPPVRFMYRPFVMPITWRIKVLLVRKNDAIVQYDEPGFPVNGHYLVVPKKNTLMFESNSVAEAFLHQVKRYETNSNYFEDYDAEEDRTWSSLRGAVSTRPVPYSESRAMDPELQEEIQTLMFRHGVYA